METPMSKRQDLTTESAHNLNPHTRNMKYDATVFSLFSKLH